MPDKTLVMVMTQGIGANLTNDEKRSHLADLKREHAKRLYSSLEVMLKAFTKAFIPAFRSPIFIAQRFTSWL
jgi:hypothetical protein